MVHDRRPFLECPSQRHEARPGGVSPRPLGAAPAHRWSFGALPVTVCLAYLGGALCPAPIRWLDPCGSGGFVVQHFNVADQVADVFYTIEIRAPVISTAAKGSFIALICSSDSKLVNVMTRPNWSECAVTQPSNPLASVALFQNCESVCKSATVLRRKPDKNLASRYRRMG